MKNFKKNSIILLLITLIVLFFILKDDFNNIVDTFLTANFLFLGVAIVIEVLYLLFETLAFHQIVKSYKKEYPFKKSLRLIVMTHFFNGITPFSTGGQPLQIYKLKKDGFRITKATNIIIQNFILYQVALVLYGLIALFLNYRFQLFSDLPVLGNLILIGFLINTLIMIVLVIISFSNRFNKFVIRLGITFLSKLKLIKDREKQEKEWEERCNDFHEGAIALQSNKGLCVKGFLYNMISLTAQYSIPFFVILALKGNTPTTVTLMNSIVSSAYVLIIGAFVPIPGASGGIEYGYLRFFGRFIQGPVLSASLLIWRTITYYLPMLIGGVVFNIKTGDEELCE